MARCRGTKRDGSPCTATVEPPQTYCWWHDPSHAQQRSRAASKAGRSRPPSREVADCKEQVRDIITTVKEGTLDRGNAAVMLQGFRVLLNYLEFERRVREQDQVLERISELEQIAAGEGRGRTWHQ